MRLHLIPSFFIGLLLFVTVITSAFGGDWSQWRGPNRDAKSSETGLLDKWPADGPPLAWKVKGVGAGYSSVSVARGRIFTLGDLDDGSYAMALNERDGSLAWQTRIGERGSRGGFRGPRSTPTVNDGQVFNLNQHADLVCLDATSGEKMWSVNLSKDFGGRMMSGWGSSESLLVDADRLICTPGGKQGTLLALDRKSGKKIWQTSDWTDRAGYSSVVTATIHGTRQYIQLTGQSVAGIEPDSGKVLWRADRKGKTAVIPTPVVADNIVFVTSGYGVGCNAFRVGKDGSTWSAEEIYANKEITNHHGGVVLLGGHVYGSTGGTFRCLNLKSGKLAYVGRSAGKGSTVYADSHLYLRSENGPVALIQATPEGLHEKSRFAQPDRSNKRAWAHPVIANGKLYLRDQDLLLCYDIGEK